MAAARGRKSPRRPPMQPATRILPPLTAPVSTSATDVTDSRVDITWSDNSSHETSYRVERSDDGGGTWSQIAAVAADSTSYSDLTVDEASAYKYRVRAAKVGNFSA